MHHEPFTVVIRAGTADELRHRLSAAAAEPVRHDASLLRAHDGCDMETCDVAAVLGKVVTQADEIRRLSASALLDKDEIRHLREQETANRDEIATLLEQQKEDTTQVEYLAEKLSQFPNGSDQQSPGVDPPVRLSEAVRSVGEVPFEPSQVIAQWVADDTEIVVPDLLFVEVRRPKSESLVVKIPVPAGRVSAILVLGRSAAAVAQSEEHPPRNREVAGSTPASGSNQWLSKTYHCTLPELLRRAEYRIPKSFESLRDEVLAAAIDFEVNGYTVSSPAPAGTVPPIAGLPVSGGGSSEINARTSSPLEVEHGAEAECGTDRACARPADAAGEGRDNARGAADGSDDRGTDPDGQRGQVSGRTHVAGGPVPVHADGDRIPPECALRPGALALELAAEGLTSTPDVRRDGDEFEAADQGIPPPRSPGSKAMLRLRARPALGNGAQPKPGHVPHETDHSARFC
jgi:hypothetical protein